MSACKPGETEAEWAEREYNPRLAVPDAAAIYERWGPRAEATRRRHPPLADLRYGEHPREVLDLFRAERPRGTVLFIHGGYWRAFSKDVFSWVADGFLGQDLSVALLNYPLCPDVSLARIADATRRGFAHLYRDVLTEAERRRIVVTGHSAGGYLAALHLATDWTEHGLPAHPLAGAVPISGVFSLPPLIPTTMNEAIRLDAAEAEALSLDDKPWLSRAALTFVVGGEESEAFHRQSEDLADAWDDLAPRVLDIPGRNHFDVIEGLAEPGSVVNREIVGMIEAGRD